MTIKRAHAVLALSGIALTSFIIPMLSAYSGYINSIQQVDQKIESFRLESARRYPEKQEIEIINQKLDRLLSDISELKGWVRGKNHESFGHP